MKTKLLTTVFLFIIYPVFAQQIIEGKLLDADTKQAIPYANIGIENTSLGTISNADGIFRLQTQSASDIITCSYIGYEPLKISVSQWPSDGKLLMKIRSIALPAVRASAYTFLYELIPKCKKYAPQKKYAAKTYYTLDSYMNGYPVEMLECYYNGEFSGHNIQALNLKAGKIQLADYNKHYFTNLETSKAVASFNVFGDNPYLPYTPFELSAKKLAKAYQLRLIDKYTDSSTVYHIQFIPTDTISKSYFSGEAWIDSATYFILKVDMYARNAGPHPFLPFWKTDSITKVDLQVRQTFKKINGELFFDVMDFRYEMFYIDRFRHINEIKSNGVLYAYDTKNIFTLPYYIYDEDASDYRKISSFPHNDFFWKHRDSVVTSEEQRASRTYLDKYGFILHQKMPEAFSETFFQHNNFVWSDSTRLLINEFKDTSIIYNTAGILPAALYKFNAQLFLDVNETAGKIHTYSKSIFDVFGSFYYLSIDSNTNCFLNIYFDLVETERMEMEKELGKTGITPQEIQSIYSRRLENMNMLLQKYLRETERGQNYEPMIKWNKYVLYRLGIDNRKRFGLKN